MKKAAFFFLSLLCTISSYAGPKIVNIVNFIRQNDYRVEGSEQKLYETTENQVRLLRSHGLKATFLLQYDALIDSRYQSLLKAGLAKGSEVGAWWEITQPQVEAAGLVWRGDHPWVSTANIAFTTGYTQEERRKLVDVYMRKFKEVFGRYPASVGSWYIDAYTLGYMRDRYGIVAACNCKDQIGTDGYTLWGGYWNQAYYPSKVNGYMPAQTRDGQVDVPVFRMLGSDPIYQYDCGLGGNGQGVITLEPVYPEAGGSERWVDWFLRTLTDGESLAFGYTQAGQENSFTWEPMEKGLTMQVRKLDSLQQAGRISVMTLGESGQWFRRNFKVTPPTSIVAEDTYRNTGLRSIWYNSRHYRANVITDRNGHVRFRDIHLFDENMASSYHSKPGTGSRFVFETLPFVDGFKWSTARDTASLRIVSINDEGEAAEKTFSNIQVAKAGKESLALTGGSLTIRMDGDSIVITDMGPGWALELHSAKRNIPLGNVSPRYVEGSLNGFSYRVRADRGYFLQSTSDSSYIFRICPENGRIVLNLTNPALQPEPLQLNGNRFVTLCFMIRTTPWEVSRDVKLHPRDEAAWHTLESVRAMREAFQENNPDGRLTWGFTLNALEDQRENYEQIRRYAVECHYKYGDEISYFPGYFPAMYLPRERINREMTEAINEITAMVGNGYRPRCIMGGFLSADNLEYLSKHENIHVAHACIWSQHAIDGGGADGSVSYPYYPSKEHFCKPAQGKDDLIDCVSLDGWTVDFICARRSGAWGHDIHTFNSRRGIGPIETYKGWGLDLGHREVMHTMGIHFDRGYELNGFGWATNIWETQMYHEFGKDLIIPALKMWVSDTKRRWPDTHFVTFGEFGELWRAAHKDNDFNYRFYEQGSGLGDSYNNLEIRWFMNRDFRLALLRDWHQEGSPAYVIDFTRYDLPAREPEDATPDHPRKDWSLMNVINQKQTRPQDKPRLLEELTSEEQQLIRKHYPELFAK